MSQPSPKDYQKLTHKFVHEKGIHHELLMMDA